MSIKKYGLLAILLSLSLCLNACTGPLVVKAEELSKDYERKTTDEGEITAAFEEAFAQFSFKLFSESAKDGEGNTLISPLSAALCLALIANGAEGETKAEMEALLGMDVASLNKALYAYTASLTNEKDSKMELANSVWFRNSSSALHVEESFLQTLADWYKAQAFGAPFDESTRQDLDNWVSDHTDGMIKKMLDGPIDPNTMMYLVNALVFDAKWAKQYENDQVQDWHFRNASGRTTTVNGLFSEESIYLEAEGVKGVAKMYKNAGYYFVGLLPTDETQDIADFASTITGARWQDLWANRSHATVRTMIPEFKTEDRTELNDILMALGMKKAFSEDSAEFLPMAKYNGKSLYLNAVVQKTYLELDRNGTKAAAITWGEMNTKSAAPMDPKEVYLDRPFLYMIVDTHSGLPLFIGTVNEL